MLRWCSSANHLGVSRRGPRFKSSTEHQRFVTIFNHRATHMPTTRRHPQNNTLNRYTSVELATISSPSLIFLTVGTVGFSWPSTVLWWLSCGLLGLLIAVGSDRTATIGYSLIDWPRPETKGDIAVSGIAYNSVLIIGTALAQVIWGVSNSLLLAASTGTFLPFWFLKHIHLLVFLGEE